MTKILWQMPPSCLEKVPYWVPSKRINHLTGVRSLDKHQLPIFDTVLQGLPQTLDGLIVCSDLQGHVKEQEAYILLGQWLPDFLNTYLGIYFPHLNAQYIGVLLCGDLFATLEKRGGGGDVRSVWNAFNSHFRWVVGVAGNHDLFGSEDEFDCFQKQEGIHFLKHDLIELDGLEIAGISGIIGNSQKPFRVTAQEYLSQLKHLIRKQPDFLLLHESPSCYNEMGNPLIRAELERANPTCLFSGHCHWSKVQHIYSNGLEVFNLDARVLFLHH